MRTNPRIPYDTQNGHDQDVSSKIDKRTMAGHISPSYFLRKECPVDYEVKPDLELNTPMVCGPSFHTIPINQREESCLQQLELNDNRPKTSCFAGIDPQYKKKHQSALEDLELGDNRPQTSGISGVKGPYTSEGYTPLDQLELEEKITAKNYTTNPQQKIDFINYQKQDIQTIDPVNVELVNRPQHPLRRNAVRRPQTVNFHSKLSNFGSYNPGVSYPKADLMVNSAKLKEYSKPRISGISAR